MAAKPIYVWNGSQWVDISATKGTNGEGIPTGGTVGQFLKKNTSTNYDTSWADLPTGSTSTAGVIQLTDSISSTSTSTAVTANSVKTLSDSILLETLTDAKGDLLVGTAADTVSKLTVGTNGTVLASDSTATEGVEWYQPFPVHASGYYYSFLPPGAGAGFVSTLGVLSFIPFLVSKTTTYTRIALRCTGGSGAGRTARMGIYNSSSTTNAPTSLVLDAGTVDLSTTGSKSITISQSLNPGLYYLAGVAQGTAAANFRGSSGANIGGNPYVPTGTVSGGVSNNATGSYSMSSVTGALPSSTSSLSLGVNPIVVYLGV